MNKRKSSKTVDESKATEANDQKMAVKRKRSSSKPKNRDRPVEETAVDSDDANAMSKDDENGKFSCSICHQPFQFESGLKKHEERHRPPGGFACSVCKERFLTDTERSLHREIVHKIFKCSLCPLKFTSSDTYNEHIAEQHGGRDHEYLVCSVCGAQFRQPIQLRMHEQSKCGTIRSYSCTECDAKFISQNTLNAHAMIHTGIKSHLCNYCGKSFLSRGQLQVHERCHTREKPFKCNLCDKAFSHRESLVTHSSVHTGIKPYICSACDKLFSCVGNLIKHRRARPQTCGLPKYNVNTKCAPRPSSKHASLFTMKKEPKTKRSHNKRHPVSVPELLIERVEMANEQIEKDETQPDEVVVEASEQVVNPSETIEFDMTCEPEMNVYEEWSEQCERNEKLRTGPDESTEMTLDESAYNVILMEDGNFILTQYEATAADDGTTTLYDVILPIDSESANIPDQNGEFIIQEIDEQIGCVYQKISTTNDAATTNYRIIDHSYERITDDDANDTIGKQSRKATSRPLQFGCKYCDLKYTSRKRLQNHLQCHGSDGSLTIRCQCCPLYFRTATEADQHKIEAHTSELTCTMCGKLFKERESLYNHVKFVHEKQKKSKQCRMCTKCGKSFVSSYALTDHEKSNCGQSPQYKCVDCGKSYHSAGALKAHRLIHTGEMAYACTTCGKSFRNKGQLKIHSRSHTGEKPYKCQHCDKTFAHRESLLTHMSLHTGHKRFMCYGCNNRFSCISNLQAHRKSHKTTCGLLPINTKPLNRPDELEMQSNQI